MNEHRVYGIDELVTGYQRFYIEYINHKHVEIRDFQYSGFKILAPPQHTADKVMYEYIAYGKPYG